MDNEKYLIDGSEYHILDALTTHLFNNGIISKNTTSSDIKDTDLRELAQRWKIKLYDAKTKRPFKREQIIKSLGSYLDQSNNRRDGRRGTNILNPASVLSLVDFAEGESPKRLVKPLPVNYFGLPPWALQRTTGAIIYQGRKPYNGKRHNLSEYDDEDQHAEDEEHIEKSGEIKKHVESAKTDNSIAQRKVAHALLTLSRTEHTVAQFLQKGGLEAIFKLAFESDDLEVLSTCASCLYQIITVISRLVDSGDEQTRFQCSKVVAALSSQLGLEEVLIRDGILLILQSLLNTSTSTSRSDTVCYTLV
eukprot:gene6982-14189_t